MSLISLTIRVVALLMVVQMAMALKCWKCRSDEDPKCGDPFDNSTLPIKDCKDEASPMHLPNARATMCRKTRQKVNGEWRYFRSCAFVGEPGIAGDERFCIMRTGTYNIFIEYCTCNSKDGCNSALSMYGLSWTKFLLMLMGSLAVYVAVIYHM